MGDLHAPSPNLNHSFPRLRGKVGMGALFNAPADNESKHRAQRTQYRSATAVDYVRIDLRRAHIGMP